MTNISVVISTFNRSESLKRTLLSVKNFAEEIIIVDNTSSDDTKKIARQFTKKIYTRPNNPMLNVNKNFGITKATGDWILYLDDDELVVPELASEIRQKINDSAIDGYWMPRKNMIFGRFIQHGIWWPDYQLRLFRKGHGSYPAKHVHEYIRVSGETEKLKTPLVHYNYDSIAQYLDKMQRVYVPNEVEKLETERYVLRWKDAIEFPVSDFLKLYFAQNGWRDGLHGLVLALFQSYYAFLVFVTLWERQKFRQMNIGLPEIQKASTQLRKESSYWIWTAVMEHDHDPWKKLMAKIYRKFFSS